MIINMDSGKYARKATIKKAETLVILFLLGQIFLAGCSNFFSSGKNDKSGINKGSVSINIPRLASWVYQAKDKTIKEKSPERVYVIADSVKVEVKTAGGAEVIAPTIFTLPQDSYASGEEKRLATINHITPGTNYTVIVSIYNNAVSTVDPVVTGEQTGVTVTAGIITELLITCLPVTTIPLTVDAGPRSDILALNEEIWYSLPVTAGTKYYLANQIPYGFGDATGVLIDSYVPTYTATYTGTLYIGAVDTKGLGSSTMNITSIESATNEGSPSSPVTLTPNTNHIYRVGHSLGSYNTSYYTFTTGDAGNYAIDTKLKSAYYSLYSDTAFSMPVPGNSSAIVDNGTNYLNLTAGTIYYLAIRNYANIAQNVSGQFMDPNAVSTASKGQGSITSPVTVSLNMENSVKVGTHVYDKNSYYSFTTGTGSDYSIGISDMLPSEHSVYITIYTEASFTVGGLQQSFSSDQTAIKFLNPSTTYYLKIINTSNLETSFMLEIISTTAPDINEGSISVPIPLPLNSVHTFKIGPQSSGYETSYYTFTTTTAGTYVLDTELFYFICSLYIDPGFTTSIGPMSYAQYGKVFTDLTADTQYYLVIANSSSSTEVKSGQLIDQTEVSANYLGQGTSSSPQLISLGTATEAMIGNHVYDQYSYYSFTTGTGLDYEINITNRNPTSTPITLILFSDSTFTSTVIFQQGYIYNDLTKLLLLSPNTTYYLMAYSSNMSNNIAPRFNISLNVVTPPTFIPLPISPSYTEGNITTGSEIIWYEATVTSGTTYSLYWDDQYEGSGTYTLDIAVSAYHENRATKYMSAEDSAYDDPYGITIAADETKIYIKVTSCDENSNTGTFAIKLQ